MIIVNLADITYCYHTLPVLDGLNWEIHSGQKIGLVGANGARRARRRGVGGVSGRLYLLCSRKSAPPGGTLKRRRARQSRP